MQAAAEPDRPTVVLVAHHGVAARYLLRTEVFTTLRDGGARVVILTPNADEPYMREEFGNEDGVVLEPLRAVPRVQGRLAFMVSWTLRFLRRYGVANGHRSRAFHNKYEGFRAQQRGRMRLLTGLMHLGVLAQWRSRRLRRAVLALETRLAATDLHDEVFDRYRPDLLVAASPGTVEIDAHLLRAARRRGVRTAAVVLGWDNPTSKGYRGADVDEIVVWSERMADQMTEFHDVPRERCFVGGVPFFDAYHREDGLPSRSALWARHRLDPERRLVVFATSSPTLWAMNEPIAETIARAIEEDALSSPAQLVIRVHPNYLRPGEQSHEGYRELARRYGHVHVDVPEVRSERLRIDRAPDDGPWLGALFKHSDVVVNVFSTTTLEAFILDRPTVLIAEEVGLGGSAGRGWAEFDHLEALARHGAGRVAHSLADVAPLIRDCLLHPDADRDARRRVAELECGPVDGRSGERVGRRLLSLAGERERTAVSA